MEQDNKTSKLNEKYSLGVTIIILLAALTIGEFLIATVGTNLALILMLVALVKAGLVIRDYMHIGKLFSGEEETE